MCSSLRSPHWKHRAGPPRLLVVPACANCGQDNPEVARFCLACGAPILAAAGAVEERKVVTVLFADLVGFTAGPSSSIPEDVRALLALLRALAAASSSASAARSRSSSATP